jgi:hypothetical protein
MANSICNIVTVYGQPDDVDRFVGTTNAQHRRKRELFAGFREYLAPRNLRQHGPYLSSERTRPRAGTISRLVQRPESSPAYGCFYRPIEEKRNVAYRRQSEVIARLPLEKIWKTHL